MVYALKVSLVIAVIFGNYHFDFVKSYDCREHHGIFDLNINNGRGLSAHMERKRQTPANEMNSEFWFTNAQKTVKQRVKRKHLINKKAKNIIFFLGDGMSIATLTAARILKGQRAGQTGEEAMLNMEEFPYTGLSKTYCTNGQTADSACSATALFTGVKANLRTIGVNSLVNFNNCTESSNFHNHVDSIVMWSQKEGKSTGIVTTTTLTHASPSGSYAHAANRNWESDFDILRSKARLNGQTCVDIARQLIENKPGRDIDVILGGGFKKFLPSSKRDPFGVKGERKDGLDLIDRWQTNNPEGKIVTSLRELNELNYKQTSKLLGIFHSSHLEYNIKSSESNPTQPRLKDMTAAAIKMLRRNPRGYFVFIEGGRIDHGHHSTNAGYALDETLEFDEAIRLAVDMTNEEETLIVVTADHSHSMTMSGYPGRGNPILGLNQYDRDSDGIPYSVLNYALGPEQYMDMHGKRLDLTNLMEDYMVKPSYIKAKTGAHAGEDVVILARGPQAHFFTGIMEQNVLPHLMAYASCVGQGLMFCDE